MKYQEKLGLAGEYLVAYFFRDKGCNVEMSSDKYDDNQDMKINGRSAEVKTQVPYFKCNSWTIGITNGVKIEHSQLNKAMSVNALFFIWPSAPGRDFVQLYIAPGVGKRAFSNYRLPKSNHRTVALLPVPTTELLATFYDEDIVNSIRAKGYIQ